MVNPATPSPEDRAKTRELAAAVASSPEYEWPDAAIPTNEDAAADLIKRLSIEITLLTKERADFVASTIAKPKDSE